MKQTTLRTDLTKHVLVLLIIVLTIPIIFVHKLDKKQQLLSKEEIYSSTNSKFAAQLQANIQEVTYGLKSTTNLYGTISKSDFIKMAKNNVLSNGIVDSFFLITDDESILVNSGSRFEADVAKYKWYQNVKETKQPYTSEVYEGRLTIAYPIIENGVMQGVLAANISADHIYAVVSQFSAIYPTSTYTIVNKDGSIIGDNKEKSLAGQAYDKYKTIISHVSENKSFNNIIDKNYVDMEPITFKDGNPVVWGLVSSTSVADIDIDTKANIIKLVGLMTIILIAFYIIISALINRIVIKPLRALQSTLNKLADYNYAEITIDEKQLNNELRATQDNSKVVIDNTRALLNEIQVQSERIKTQSNEINNYVNSTTQSSQEIAKTSDEIAVSSTSQAEDTANCSEQVTSIGQAIDNMSSMIESIINSMEEMNERKEEGSKVLSNLHSTSNEVKDANDIINTRVQQLEDSSNRISKASNMIRSIAEQTNLLSLNASIEAARAGEHGRGFAVVAGEIGKLAVESGNFSEKIVEIVDELNDSIKAITEAINSSIQITSAQLSNISDVSSKFDSIAEIILTSTEEISNLKEVAVDIDSSKNQILDAVQSLTAASEENAASTEEVSATIQSQLADMELMRQSVVELNSSIKSLEEEIHRFKL